MTDRRGDFVAVFVTIVAEVVLNTDETAVVGAASVAAEETGDGLLD